MKRNIHILTLLLFSSFGSSTHHILFAQNSSVSKVETSWEIIRCPFDPGKAMLSALCGRLRVPENYDDPKGRMIEMAFMMVKAQKNTDPEHPVLFLNGGPGQTSLYFAETLLANPLIHKVVVDRDWVFFDQRGTGRSTPQLFCPDDLKTCRDDLIKQGIDLSKYNSAAISRDMEELRKVLGVSQWKLWGISYGSRLALNMARYFPSSVHSIVHDAPGLPEGQESVDDAWGFDAALNRLFTKCAGDSACAAKYPRLRERFVDALPRLREQPLSAGEKQFDDNSVVAFIFNWMYPRGYSTYEQRIQNLLIFMDAAARSDSKVMDETQQIMRKEERLDEPRPPEPMYARYCTGQNLSVYCNERKPFETQNAYLDIIDKSEIARSFLRRFNDPSDCDLWPSGQAEKMAGTHVYYDGPQLCFTGELDASSSGLAGYKIDMSYANAINVVFKNGYHGQFPADLPSAEDYDYWLCALKLAQQFFNDPHGKLDTDCAETRMLRLVR